MKKVKKILVAALCVCMVAALAACGGNEGSNGGSPLQKNEETPLVLATPNTVENYADFTLFKISTTKKVEGSVGGGIYYENQNSGETYVDVVIDITNNGAAAISSNDIVVVSAKNAAGAEYGCNLYAVETNNATYVSQFENIAPLSTVRLHCAISVPETETDLKIKLAVNGSEYTYDYKLGADVSNARAINAGETIEEADFATMVFKGIEYTDDLLPSNTSGSYRHYEIDNTSNTYLVAKFDITNYTSGDKKCDTFMGVKATYMDKYTYTGFVVVEDEDGKGFDQYEQVSPLTTRQFYYLIEVPKTVSSNPAKLTISFNGQEYIYAAQ